LFVTRETFAVALTDDRRDDARGWVIASSAAYRRYVRDVALTNKKLIQLNPRSSFN
jgi:hypothetical protein